MAVTPLSGRMWTSLECTTHLNVIDAPPNRTPGMLDVVVCVTSSNSLSIEEPKSSMAYCEANSLAPDSVAERVLRRERQLQQHGCEIGLDPAVVRRCTQETRLIEVDKAAVGQHVP